MLRAAYSKIVFIDFYSKDNIVTFVLSFMHATGRNEHSL